MDFRLASLGLIYPKFLKVKNYWTSVEEKDKNGEDSRRFWIEAECREIVAVVLYI